MSRPLSVSICAISSRGEQQPALVKYARTHYEQPASSSSSRLTYQAEDVVT